MELELHGTADPDPLVMVLSGLAGVRSVAVERPSADGS
jgi:hypothetical protein